MTDENTQKTDDSTPTDDQKPEIEETPAEEPKTETSEEAPVEVPEEKPVEELKADETPLPVEETKPEEPKEEVSELPNIKPGMTVRVHQKIRETNTKGEEKERIQIFEGMVLAKKHGNESGATITVRKISHGVGVEKIFPLHSPNVVQIEPIKQARVRHSKLYFLRKWKKKLKETIIKNDT